MPIVKMCGFITGINGGHPLVSKFKRRLITRSFSIRSIVLIARATSGQKLVSVLLELQSVKLAANRRRNADLLLIAYHGGTLVTSIQLVDKSAELS